MKINRFYCYKWYIIDYADNNDLKQIIQLTIINIQQIIQKQCYTTDYLDNNDNRFYR